jgi:hypothetical protein
MNAAIFLILLALIFVGGGFYLGRPMFGGGAIGTILMASLVLYFAGGFRTKS